MGETARKVNFIIPGEVVEELERLVPPGRRSRVVTDALRKELERLRREELTNRLGVIREAGPVYHASDLIEELRKDRGRDE